MCFLGLNKKFFFKIKQIALDCKYTLFVPMPNGFNYLRYSACIIVFSMYNYFSLKMVVMVHLLTYNHQSRK